MNKAYSYIRFSSPEQAKGRSQQRQLEQAKRYCEQHNLSLAVEAEYTFFDKGKSAFKGEHLGADGQLARFIGLVEEGAIEKGSYLIVESLDRLSREHVGLALPRFIDLLRLGINVVTLADGKTYSENFTELDLVLSVLEMSRAHGESAMKARRLHDAWSAKQKAARDGKKPLSRMCPQWLELIDGKYVLIESHVDVIRRIYQMTVDGYGKHTICAILNQEGVRTFRGKTTWGTSSISKILGNRAVLGEYQPYSRISGVRQAVGEPVPDYYPTVIEESQFYQAMEATSSRRVFHSTKQSADFNIFQGVAKCGKCGAALYIVSKGRGLRYLTCANWRKGTCDARSIPLNYAESTVREILVKIDSLALVQENRNVLAKALAAVNGRMAEKIENLELCKERARKSPYSDALWNVIEGLEREVAILTVEKADFEARLSANKIIDKVAFFEQLDLVSYKGRSAANALMKRLHVLICYVMPERREMDCFVLQNMQLILGITIKNDKLDVMPATVKQAELAMIQDHDGTFETAFLRLDAKFRRMLEEGLEVTEEVIDDEVEKLAGRKYRDFEITDD